MSTGLRSQLAPKGLDFSASDFVISDKYATILTVISYPRYINPGFLSSLTSMSGIKVVIKHIPMPFSVIQKMLNKEIPSVDYNEFARNVFNPDWTGWKTVALVEKQCYRQEKQDSRPKQPV